MLGIVDRIQYKFLTKRRLFLATLTIFATIGVYSLGVGIWLYLERTDFHELTPSSFSAFSTAGLCCSTGVAVWIICTVGFISATAYNRRLLYTFIGFVILLAFIQTITGILGFAYKDATREHVRTDLLHNINRQTLMTGNGRFFNLTLNLGSTSEIGKCSIPTVVPFSFVSDVFLPCFDGKPPFMRSSQLYFAAIYFFLALHFSFKVNARDTR
ncbi:hypothetical protein COOONC_22525 [Cooperia oncophora]